MPRRPDQSLALFKDWFGLAADARLPRLFAFTVQRIADVGTHPALLVLTERLGQTTDAERQSALLSGITQIVNRSVTRPSVSPAR